MHVHVRVGALLLLLCECRDHADGRFYRRGGLNLTCRGRWGEEEEYRPPLSTFRQPLPSGWLPKSSSGISIHPAGSQPAHFGCFVVAIRDKLQLDVWQIQLLLNAFRALVVMISFLMEVDLRRGVSDHRRVTWLTGNRRKSCRSRCRGVIYTLAPDRL